MHIRKSMFSAKETLIVIRDIWFAVKALNENKLVHNAINHNNVFVSIGTDNSITGAYLEGLNFVSG